MLAISTRRALTVLALTLAACTSRSPAPLPAPAGLAGASPVPGALVVTWQPVASASGYAVYVAPSGGASVRHVVAGATSSWSDAGLVPGATYDVAVAAVVGTREGPRSATSRLATRSPAVLSLQSAAPARIALTWTAASDGTYLLYRSTSTPLDPATATVIPVATTGYVDDGVSAGTTYHYAVAGVAAGLTSAPGPELEVTSPLPQPAVAEPVAVVGVTAFGQTIAADDRLEVFPGQANYWDLDRDLSIASGGFSGPFRGALLLHAGLLSPGAPTLESLQADVLAQPRLSPFPFDQDFSELAFLAPLFAAADGVRTAELSDGATIGLAPLAGTRSLFLNGTASSRAEQVLRVSGVTAPLVLSWSHVFEPSPAAFPGAPLPTFTVSFRGTDGTPLGPPVHVATAREERPPGPGGAPGVSVDVGPWPGYDEVVLSFELSGPAPSYAEIDDVSLDGGAVVVTNGDFEAGSMAGGDAGWTAPSPSEPQNVQGGPRTLCVGDGRACTSQLVVRRTFFAAPASRWARVTDVFENPGASPVDAAVVYLTILAAGGNAELHEVAGGGAVVGSDLTTSGTRDLGIVYGNGTAVFRSATAAAVAAGTPDGAGLLYVVHPLTVAPGARVALVHFVLLAGSSSAFDGGATAAALDADAAAILTGFGSPVDFTYRNWMPAGTADVVSNF